MNLHRQVSIAIKVKCNYLVEPLKGFDYQHFTSERLIERDCKYIHERITHPDEKFAARSQNQLRILTLPTNPQINIRHKKTAVREELFALRAVVPPCLRYAQSNPVEDSHPPDQPSNKHQTQKNRYLSGFLKYGGEGGIRTLDTLRYTRFPGVLLRPLGHLTVVSNHC